VVIKGNISTEDIRKILLEEIDVQVLIKKAMVKTGVFKRRIVHVARKFGALAKDADLSTLSLASLIKSFEGSAIYDEALNTALASDADVEKTMEVLKRVRAGEIDIVVIKDKKITPIGRIGMEEIGRRYDLVPPDKMRRVYLESTKARLLSEAKTLVCAACWDYVEMVRIKDLPAKIICPKCESQKIGVLEETEEKAWRLCEKMHISEEVPSRDKRILERARKTSELVSEHGKTAAIALAGRISIQDAREILEQGVRDERFFELIIEAERNMLKRKFFVPAAAEKPREKL
jgi:ATP-dependent Lhr-like helicase